MNKNIVIGALVVIVLALAGWWLYSQSNQAPAPSNQTGTVNNPDQKNPVSVGADVTVGKTYEITYTNAGYSPSSLTINVGDTVTWKNESSGGDWVGSANHPSHTVYSGTTLQQHCPDPNNTAFDECKADNPGDSWSFTFTKAGSWGYHNHVNASKFGKIVVE
jgi:plastocyanin